MPDFAVFARELDRGMAALCQPMRLIPQAGGPADFVGQVRGLRAAEIAGLYEEGDCLVVIPATQLAGLRPAKLDHVEVAGRRLVFIEAPRAVYAGGVLVTYKGVARGQQ